MNSKALVQFSGGQDSATCRAWALARYASVETLGFECEQRHSVEWECRLTDMQEIRKNFPAWSLKSGMDHMLDLKLLGQIRDTAHIESKALDGQKSGLPNTFVTAVDYRRGLDVLVGGLCETDYSGYPDCRDNTLKSMQVPLSLDWDSPLCPASDLRRPGFLQFEEASR